MSVLDGDILDAQLCSLQICDVKFASQSLFPLILTQLVIEVAEKCAREKTQLLHKFVVQA